MERIKYLRNNGIMGMGAGMLMFLYLAEHLETVPCWLFVTVLASLMVFAGIRDFVAAQILKDEEDMLIEGDY